MIQITAFTHGHVDNEDQLCFGRSDIHIVNIKDDFIEESDFDLIWQSLEDIILKDLGGLKLGEWYKFDVKRVYDDDGSGAMSDLWFNIYKAELITNEEP